MNIFSRWAKWKIWVGAVMAVFVVADIALLIVLWQTNREAPNEMRAHRDQLAAKAAKLDADVARAERIRASLPQVDRQSADFYQKSFLNPKTAYSTVDADLASIAAKAGVRTSGFSDTRTEIPGRKVAELQITMSVEGDYSALLKFVSGLEQSKNFYFLNALQLGSGKSNEVRLQLGVHTYIRT